VQTTSYWLAQPLPKVPSRSSEGPVDVVVIGGGVTGCSCALTLARGGLRVRLIDAREVAAGASGRNGGFALRGLATSYDAARAQLGVTVAADLWQLTERSLDRMASLAGDALRRVGSVRLAADAVERDALLAEVEALREDGFEAEWLDPLPAPLTRLFAGGFLHPRDGALSPALWVRRLAAAAAAAGAEIIEGLAVDRDALDALRADAVVVATDGLAHELLPELGAALRPVRGQVLATEPLPELVYARPHYARHGFDYWQQLPDGRLILGGRRDASFATEATAEDATTPLLQSELEALATELTGHAPRVTHRWSGIWGETPDLLPLAGRVPGDERLWVAAGYSGHGNVLGFACGDLVAQALLGGQPGELGFFDPARVL
jgi:gamma-glutamylputrescine oxidase